MKQTSQQKVEDELIAITRKLLDESGVTYPRRVTMDVSLYRHLSMDSLARAELFRRIEKKFNVRIADSLLAEVDTLNDIANYLEQEPASVIVLSPQKIIAPDKRLQLDSSQASTLIDILFLYGEKSPDGIHLYFHHEDGSEEIITYGKLLEFSLRVAKGLQMLGLQQGETVAIMQPSHPHFFYTFYGILLAGGIPVPIYPPYRLHMLSTYAEIEARILNNAGVRILVAFAETETISRILKSFVPGMKHVVTAEQLLKSPLATNFFHPHADYAALIQYTSGSTAAPKGVLLTHYNLLANIRAYGEALSVKPDDIAISWLPLYHDMGLIGMCLGSLYFGVPLVLMTPFSFLNHPERWLWNIHYHRATLSGAPNFAYELCARKIDPGLLEGLDLSSLRAVANGAEKVYPRTLRDFAEKFAPYGLRQDALLPVYGLAESTVCLTVPPLNRKFLIDRIDRKKFEEECLAIPSTAENTLEFVSCGVPLKQHEIRIVNEKNNVLQERMVGHLQFRGPSSMQAYFNQPKATEEIYHDNWLDSGDLAYQAKGEIYITGRYKDLIIKAGRNIYPAEIEELTAKVAGVRQGCIAAFSVTDVQHANEKLVIVAETREKNKVAQDKMITAINELIVDSLDVVPDHVVMVAPHVVPKTSSGKLQRAACKALYIENRLQQMQVPIWWQMTKIVSSSFANRVKTMVLSGLKLLYTCYIVVVFALTFIPLYWLMRVASRAISAKCMKMWAKWMLRFAFCPVGVKGEEKLSGSERIYVANHASYVDALLMLAILAEDTRFVVKQEVFHMPFLRTMARKLDYLGIDRLDFSKGLEDTKRINEALKEGHSILIFPEGTFGYAAGLRPFRLGAFKIAIDSGMPICPVAINGARQIWRGEEMLMHPHPVTITVCDLQYPSGTEWQDVIKLRNMAREEILKYCGEPSIDFIAGYIVAQ